MRCFGGTGEERSVQQAPLVSRVSENREGSIRALRGRYGDVAFGASHDSSSASVPSSRLDTLKAVSTNPPGNGASTVSHSATSAPPYSYTWWSR